MKISIPTLPNPSGSTPGYVNPLANISLPHAVAKTKEFLDKGKGKVLVLTGAGVSVDSGIRAYRGSEGHCESVFRAEPVCRTSSRHLQIPQIRIIGQSHESGSWFVSQAHGSWLMIVCKDQSFMGN